MPFPHLPRLVLLLALVLAAALARAGNDYPLPWPGRPWTLRLARSLADLPP